MIDEKKYEGHTPAPWVVGWPNNEGFPENAVFIDGGKCSEGYDGCWSYSPFFLATASGKEISEVLGVMLRHRRPDTSFEFDGGNTPLADVFLMADSPLKDERAEVKRLREGLTVIVESMQTWMDDSVGKPLFKSFIDHLKELIEEKDKTERNLI